MTAAFATLYGDRLTTQRDHLLGMFLRAHGWHADYSGVAELTDHPGIGTASETHRPDPVGIGKDDLDNLFGTRLEAVEIHAEIMRRHVLQPGNLARQLGRFHHRAGQKTKGARIAARSYQLRGRNPAHGGLHYRQPATQHFGEGCGKRITHRSALCLLLVGLGHLAAIHACKTVTRDQIILGMGEMVHVEYGIHDRPFARTVLDMV